MALNILKDKEIKEAKAKEKLYFFNDGGGLRLAVKPNGTKLWEFRFTINSKRNVTTFKTYPTVTLEQARKKRDEYQKLINDGINPIEYFKQLKEENILDKNGMFLNISFEWLKKEEARTSPNTHINKVRAFEKDIIPFLKNKHIKEIAIKDVVKILEIKLLQSHDVATKIFSYLDSLFRYSVYKGYCNRNILNDIKRGDIIPSKKYRHYSKITDIDKFKELVNSIYTYNGSHSVRGALKLVLHLPFRAENVCNLKWEYVDFEKKVITIPRSEMKIKDINLDDFKLPMSEEVENILRDQYEISGYQEWVFLGTNNRSSINSESPNKALKIMGFNDEANGKKITLHGFRGTL